MQYFAAQLNSNQQTTRSLRASQYRKPKKRDREEELNLSSSSSEDGLESRPTSHTRSFAAHVPLEIQQLRAAGLLPEEDFQIPPAPFPHAPFETTKTRYAASKLQNELSGSPARLYNVHATSKDQSIGNHKSATSLKKNHLDVLSTVMHRCLLQGDYERAGRAWGMLLRTHVAGGTPLDPRNHGRWGIGAEILLHKTQENPTKDPHEPTTTEKLFDRALFSERGFELAREYYERLIIEYPNRKTSPRAIDERTFYPAMFSLWIFEVHEKSRRARELLHLEYPQSTSGSISMDSDLAERPGDYHAHEDAIQVEELTRAMEIAERVNQLIASPPFDKQADLLLLRGHIGVWISTLVVGATTEDEDWDMESDQRAAEADLDTISHQLNQLINCQKELQQAQSFFQRAEANGATRSSATATNLDLKLKELTRKIARLRKPNHDIFASG